MLIKNCAEVPIGRVAPGATAEIPDKNGIPTEAFWRRRLKDAAIDGCIEIVQPAKAATKAKEG